MPDKDIFILFKLQKRLENDYQLKYTVMSDNNYQMKSNIILGGKQYMMINKRLINLCRDSKKYILLTVLVNWISTLCNIVTVVIIGGIINNLFIQQSNGVEMKSFIVPGIIIGLMLAIRFICNILYSRFSSYASANARTTLRNEIYSKLLRLGNGYTKVESTSSIVQMSVEGVEQLEVYFGKYLPQFFYALLVPVTLFIVLSFISFKASIVFLLGVPLIPMSIIVIMKTAKKILKDYWKSYSNLGGTFLENLQGLTTLKVFNMDEERHIKMNEESEKFRRITMKVLSMQLNSISIMDLIAFGGSALGIIVALYQFKNGEIMVGSLLTIIILSSEFFIPLRLLGSYFHIAMNGMAASDRIFKLLDTEERKSNQESKVSSLRKDKVQVKLENAEFTYDGVRKVIHGIDMDIKEGGITAVVGESGTGKSTIASLIMNDYELTSGNVFINGISTNDMSHKEIYERIGLVSTNSYIFTGTILDNLIMAKPEATEKELDEALEKAHLKEFVSGLKDGVNTFVGQGGSALSGGQRQRLALARIILCDQPMIIFDEATSNIDVESEELIWKAIYQLSEHKTILVISHRLASVVEAKEIYVLDKGRVVEKGNHQELMAVKGKYSDMVQVQRELEDVRRTC